MSGITCSNEESDEQDSGLSHSLKTNRERLIKDDLGCYCLKTFETAKGRKKSGATGSRIQGLWLKLPVLCHWATTPTVFD